MKKILIAILVIILVALTIYFAWSFYKASKIQGPGAPENIPATGAEVSPGTNATIKIISSIPALDYWIKQGTGEVFFFGEDGKLYKTLEQSEPSLMSPQTLENFNNLKASSDGSLAAVSYGSPNAEIFSIFNTQDLTWQPLPEGTASVAWDPTRPRLAYLKDSALVSNLNLFDASNKQITEVVKLSQKGLNLAWAAPDEIYLNELPSALTTSSIWALNLKTRTLRLMIEAEKGLMVNWFRDGAYGLKFRKVSGQSGQATEELSLIDNHNTGTLASLPVTLPLKCAFEAEIAYCGIPQALPSGVSLPDDYLKRKVYSIDDLVAWNYKTGELKNIFDTRQIGGLDIEKVSKLGNKIFFINRYDGKIYSIEISD